MRFPMLSTLPIKNRGQRDYDELDKLCPMKLNTLVSTRVTELSEFTNNEKSIFYEAYYNSQSEYVEIK